MLAADQVVVSSGPDESWQGTGTLVHPRFVLLHPPLPPVDQQKADDDHWQVRFDAGGSAVDGQLRQYERSGERLAGVELGLDAPMSPVRLTSAADTEDATADALEDYLRRRESLLGRPEDDPYELNPCRIIHCSWC